MNSSQRWAQELAFSHRCWAAWRSRPGKLADLYRAPVAIRRRLLKAVTDLRAEEAPARVVLRREAWRLRRRTATNEENAAEIRGFGNNIVPGLLQTADYAIAVFAGGADTSRLRNRTGRSPNE